MASKRGPSVLVTDARERPPYSNRRGPPGHRRSDAALSFSDGAGPSSTASAAAQQQQQQLYQQQQQQHAHAHQRLPMRHISVDNVLRDASEIPSGQPRGPPAPQRLLPTAALSAAAAAARRRGLIRRTGGGITSGPGVGSGVAGGGGGAGGALGGAAGGSSGGGLSTSIGIGGGAGGVLLRPALPGSIPSRTSKVSEKLVLLPETSAAVGSGKRRKKAEDRGGDQGAAENNDEEDEEDDEDDNEDDEDLLLEDDEALLEDSEEDEAALTNPFREQQQQRQEQKAERASSTGFFDGSRPPRDDELEGLRRRNAGGGGSFGGAAMGGTPPSSGGGGPPNGASFRGKSYAERLPKGQRAEKVARLTAYCTAQAFKMQATAAFLRTHHASKTKLYDDCLYTVYHLPLLPGREGFRVRSRPMLKTPGTGKTVLDLEIERSERRDEHMGYGDDPERGTDGQQQQQQQQKQSSSNGHYDGPHDEQPSPQSPMTALYPMTPSLPDGPERLFASAPPVNRLAPDAKLYAEMFVFSYGVVVFWNFTEHQEKDILADLTFAEKEAAAAVAGDASSLVGAGSRALVTRPLDEADFETEEFHFEYSARVKRPRVFNDMITLLPGSDHMVKLTISHAIAQSTKLCYFEEKMSETMQNAQHVPKRLALTGELNMSRTEILRILGRLFQSRVDINLSSNILDVPNFFWDAEPTLHPLYVAIREYLEIDPRIQVLNERCRVFLDLAEILANSVASAKMSNITWIVIILIVLSIMVTVTEVVLRFAILEKEKGKYTNARVSNNATATVHLSSAGAPALQAQAPLQKAFPPLGEGRHPDDLTLDELRAWVAQLGVQERAAVCGGDLVGRTFAGV